MWKFLGILGAVFIAANSYGQFSIQLDAGQLRGAGGSTLPADNGPDPHPGGAVLLFISAGADGVFETPTQLTPGNWVAGDDVLLSIRTSPGSASGFNTQGGTNETNNPFVITATPPAGQQIGLMWFPGITYSQWLGGQTPSAGLNFGFYNPSYYGNATNNPDGGSAWIVPAAGNLVSLNFFTNEPPGGGSQAPIEGWAQFTVIPEPSTFALIGVGALAVPFLRRRKA